MKSYIEVDKIKGLEFVNLAITTRRVNAKDINDLKDSEINELFTLDNLTSNMQIHSDIVNRVCVEDIGVRKEGDALITDLKNVPLIVFTADCVPVVMIDKKNKAIGVAHAGWRGTFEEISKNTIHMMIESYKTNPADLYCIIGPSIGSCCYEVSKDLYDKFNNRFYKAQNISHEMNSKYFLNLWNINKATLIDLGVSEDNIVSLDLCTNCNSDLLHSYRAHNKTDRRIGTIIELI